MKHYFFHLHECGSVTPDHEGRIVLGDEEARAIAVKAAREIMCAEVATGRLCLSCCIVIEDPDGHEVMRVPFNEVVAVTGL